MSIDEFLGLFPNVRPHGKEYRASCPTQFHKKGDQSRGLFITPINDRILIHCHAGCSAAEVCDALGLSLKDLFFETSESSRRPTITHRERLALVEQELWVVALGAQQAKHGTLSGADADRLADAAKRLAGLARPGGPIG